MEEQRKISFALSFVSGFVDTAGFIALFGLFTAHVTGNLVLAGASYFSQNNMGNLAAKLLMLPVFVLAVMLSTFFIKYRQVTLSSMLLCEALFIICFSIAGGLLVYKATESSNTLVLLTASFAVAGMAIQNTYMRKLLNKYTPNTVMTGNFTQFSIYLLDLTVYFLKKTKWPATETLQSVLDSFRKVMTVLSGFLIGCSFGALLVSKLGLMCCLLPAIILLWVRRKINARGNG